MEDTINISQRAIVIVAVIALLLFGTFAAFFGIRSDNSKTTSSDSSQDIPEKCRIPSGQDMNSWKEHLGHHAETRDCLQYFN